MGNFLPNLECFGICDFEKSLTKENLLPGRHLLLEKKKEVFASLRQAGITNLLSLTQALKSKSKALSFAQNYSLDKDYVIMLRREVLSYTPKPYAIKTLNISEEEEKTLVKINIRNTKDAFEKLSLKEKHFEIATEIKIDVERLAYIYELSSLVRINGVGPVFAAMLYDVGVKSPKALSRADATALYERLLKINKTQAYTKAKFSACDIEYCISFAKCFE